MKLQKNIKNGFIYILVPPLKKTKYTEIGITTEL